MATGEGRPVTVVVDSTSDLPDQIKSRHNIVTVPLTVTFGDQSFTDGVDMTPSQFLTRLKASSTTPTTSQPPITAFAEVFAAEVERGHDVLCMTIAAELSGTSNAARLAADSVDPSRVRILDSRTVSIHLGLGALAAARAAAGGDDLDAVESAAVDAIARSQIFVVLET